jgi:hypothetical protein
MKKAIIFVMLLSLADLKVNNRRRKKDSKFEQELWKDQN